MGTGVRLARWLASFVAGLAAAPSTARGERDLSRLSLEELLDIQVAVVTRSDRPLRETPGVVTVVTRDEIAAWGARDLVDVLRQVPGFVFALDLQGVHAIGFRGMTGEGGQILILVDGIELNETMYGTPLTYMPVAMIEKIEISRGPGSVVYGGYAELAVINIITRAAAGTDGVVVGSRYGQMEDALGYRDVYAAGRTLVPVGGGVRIGVAASIGEGRRSDAEYRDFFGSAYPLPNRIDPSMIDVGLAWRELDLRLIGHWFDTTSRDAGARSEPAAVPTDFHGAFAALSYAWHVAPRITVTPRLAYKRQRPWKVTDLAASTYYQKTSERYLASTHVDWEPSERVAILGGAEVFVSRARLDDRTNVGVGFQEPLAEGDRDQFTTASGFGQAIVRHRWATLSLGLRLEWNDRFGAVILPRLGLTRVFGRAHLKLLASQAFRAPGHEPYSLNLDLRPERTTAFEIEGGYQLGDHAHLGLNVFDVTIRDPFVYDFDEAAGRERYVNFPKTGSRGVEAVMRIQHTRARGELAAAFFDTGGRNQVDLYAVPGRDDVTSGFPAYTVSAHGRVGIADHLVLGPSAIYIGPVWGPMGLDGAGDVVFGVEDPALLLGVFATRSDLAVRGLDIGLGVHDLLDRGVQFVERSNIAHAPLPGPTREYALHVEYRRELE